jgi:hypothetical protein
MFFSTQPQNGTIARYYVHFFSKIDSPTWYVSKKSMISAIFAMA